MKQICSKLFLASLVLAFSAGHALATTISTEEPERCGERGSTVHRTVGVVTAPVSTVRKSAAMPTPAVAPIPKVAPAPVAIRKPSVTKSPRVAPRTAPTTAAPTPGMGILLKMANGASGGDVTWSPSKPADNSTGASWIL